MISSQMGKKDKQKAAARARAERATIQINVNDAYTAALEIKHEVILVDDDSDVDCGYTGGVNYMLYSDEENTVEDV
jgi:hypothetical protein